MAAPAVQRWHGCWMAIRYAGTFGVVLDPVHGGAHRLFAAPVAGAHKHVLGHPYGERQPDDLK
jgi:hypothetical protein